MINRYAVSMRYCLILLVAWFALSGSLYSQSGDDVVVGTWFQNCPHPYQPGYQKTEGTSLVINAGRTGAYSYVHGVTGKTVAVPLTWEFKDGYLSMTEKESSRPVFMRNFRFDNRKNEFEQSFPEAPPCYWFK